MRHWARMYRLILGGLLIFFASGLSAAEVIPLERAFIFSLSHEATSLKAEWFIAPKCYLYQGRLEVALVDKQGNKQLLLQANQLPPAIMTHDPYFGTQAIYQEILTLPISLTAQLKNIENATATVQIQYQGCSEAGFCYPPVTQWFALKIVSHQLTEIMPLTQAPTFSSQKLPSTPVASLKEHRLLPTIATFYFLGILLAFTPCVLPMIPILFGVIVGQHHLNTRKAFWLSLCYVLSMALTYALAGLFVATVGKNLQAYLQKPLIISLFSLLLIYLGLSQIGYIRFTFPTTFGLKERITHYQKRLKSGTYIGAALMGVFATLIASPCVSAPLIGALSYISHSGNKVLGGSALFALGLGMGTVLLAIGTLGGKYFPKAGPWMHAINQLFAMVMFGLSLWLLDRVFHGPWLLLLWGVLCLYIASCMHTFQARTGWLGRIGVLWVVYAIVLFWGAALGEADPLKPLTFDPWARNIFTSQTPILDFKQINSLSELTTLQAQALDLQRPMMMVFSAKWCSACSHLEQNVFTNKKVQEYLAQWERVRADVSAYNKTDQALLRKFDLIGPPALLFFDKNGSEMTNYRLTGDISAQDFVRHLLEIDHKISKNE